jgi:hypothetical protein
MQRIIHIHPAAPAKPPAGGVCNGCGVCCTAEPCPVGMLVSRRKSGSCDALLWNGESRRYTCGMVVEPRRFMAKLPRWLAGTLSRFAMRMIAAGKGCDCDLAVEPQP